jgi:hypothetical protein
MDALERARRATLKRHERQEEGRAKHGYGATTEGRAAVEWLLPALAEFMRKESARPPGDEPCVPPPAIAHIIEGGPASRSVIPGRGGRCRLHVRTAITYEEIAAVALSTLLNFLAADEREFKDKAIGVKMDLANALLAEAWLRCVSAIDPATYARIKRAPIGWGSKRYADKKRPGRHRLARRAGYWPDEWPAELKLLTGHWLLVCLVRGLEFEG